MGKTIFRQKSMQKITSPEQMNDYIRVSNPSVWMILAAVIVLLAGVCVWGVFGHLDTVLQTGSVCKNGRLVVYIGEKDFAEIGENTVFSVNGSEYALSNLDDTPVQLDENFDSYLIHLIGLSEGDWVYALETNASGVKDGTYTVSVITERVKPINFVLN